MSVEVCNNRWESLPPSSLARQGCFGDCHSGDCPECLECPECFHGLDGLDDLDGLEDPELSNE